MKHIKVVSKTILLMACSLTWLSSANAQGPPDAPPRPAAKSAPTFGLGDDQVPDESPVALQPDNRPLTGFQQLTLGTMLEKHSYWIPGISYTNLIQSNALTQGGTNVWASTSYVSGNLSLLQNWGTAQLSLNYSGGEAISTQQNAIGGQFHQLSAVQNFNWDRWQVTLLDELTRLPQAQFGFGAASGISIPGVGGQLTPTLPSLQSGFSPAQSILTQVGPETSNTFGTQLSYSPSSRTSFTIGGVFSVLRFSQAGNIQSNDVVLNAGYNHQVSKTDILGVSYRFSAYEFIDSPQAMGIHVIQAAYGKKITGRLALQISGGPEITSFRVPIATGVNTQHVDGTASATLSRGFAAGLASLSYTHGANNGSGVLFGATSDQVTGNANRQLGRIWRGNVSLGYARTSSLLGSSSSPTVTYNTVYVGAGTQRPIGRNADFTMTYAADIQTSSDSVCAGPNCGRNFTTHVISVGMSWRSRPYVIH
jgi:hypothetical protein